MTPEKNEINPRICNKEKPCCVHRCCNAQNDEICCPNCESKALEIDWSHDDGFHK